MKIKINLKQVISIVLSAMIVTYLVYNAFTYSYTPLETLRILEETTIEETFEFKGFALRDEEIIDSNFSGAVIPLVSDGKRVAKGDTIAVVCQNEGDAASYSKLAVAKKELERYISLNNQSGVEELSADKLNTNIANTYNDLMDSISSGLYDNLSESAIAFEDKCATKQILAEGSIDLGNKISALEQEIAALSSKSISCSNVAAPDSGYYINTVDGYENTLNYSEALALSADQINAAIQTQAKKSSGSSLGKIVESYRWYIVGVVDNKYASHLPKGKSVSVNLPDEGLKHVKMSVESVKTQGDKLAVVLSCNLMNETYANLRIQNIQIVTKSNTGYKMPSDVVRFNNNNQSGVYVLRGKIITFIFVEIIYSDDDFVLISTSNNAGKGITLYDEVITKGKDLEDGKVIT